MKFLALASLCLMGLCANAQSNSYPTTGNPTIYDYSPTIILKRNTAIGGFTQGIQTLLQDGTENWFFGNLHDQQWRVSKGDFNAPKMVIQSTGEVGIGTESPRAALDVAKYLSYSYGTVLGRQSEGDGTGLGTFIGLKGYSTASTERNFAIVHDFYGSENSSINFHRGPGTTGGFLSFGTGTNTEKLRITADGDVGIGTITPTEKLSVNGKIRAKEIKVETTNWPDYVFDEDYKNMELSELEKYIKLNQHLPNVPSAKNVSENGVELGEMNKILLQKIEELTLHLIEKDKIINKQEQRLKAIETKLKMK